MKTTHLLLLTTLLLGGCYDMRAPESALLPAPYRAQVTEKPKESHIKLIEIEVQPFGVLSLTPPNASEGITQIASIKRYLKSVSKSSTIQLNVSPAANGKDLIKALDFCKAVGIDDVKIQRTRTTKKLTKKDNDQEDVRALKNGILILHIQKDGTVIHNHKTTNTQKIETILESQHFKKVFLRTNYRPPNNLIENLTKLCMNNGVPRVILTTDN